MSDEGWIEDWVWLLAAILTTVMFMTIAWFVFQDMDRKTTFMAACHKQGGEAVFRYTQQNTPLCIKQEALKFRYDVTN